MAASENTRNGIITALIRKSLPNRGNTTNATARITPSPMRSCKTGNTAMSAA